MTGITNRLSLFWLHLQNIRAVVDGYNYDCEEEPNPKDVTMTKEVIHVIFVNLRDYYLHPKALLS